MRSAAITGRLRHVEAARCISSGMLGIGRASVTSIQTTGAAPHSESKAVSGTAVANRVE